MICKFICIEVLEDGPPQAWISVDGVEVRVELETTLTDAGYHILPIHEQQHILFSKAVALLRDN